MQSASVDDEAAFREAALAVIRCHEDPSSPPLGKDVTGTWHGRPLAVHYRRAKDYLESGQRPTTMSCLNTRRNAQTGKRPHQDITGTDAAAVPGQDFAKPWDAWCRACNVEAGLLEGESAGVLPRESRAWIFQGNPRIYDVRGAVRALDEDVWLVKRYASDIHDEDRVYLWESGSGAGVIGLGEVTDEVREREDEVNRFTLDPSSLEGIRPRVSIRILGYTDPILTRAEIAADDRLQDLSILHFAQGTNFPVTPAEASALDELLSTRLVRTEPGRIRWWVNQGQTYLQERDGRYLWAPQHAKDGGPRPYWTTMTHVQPGDRIVHYRNGAIRAVSRAWTSGQEAVRPGELPEGPWGHDGWLVRSRYEQLAEPIRLDSIGSEWLTPDSGPFDVNGKVKQGYLFSVSDEFGEELV